MQLKSPITITNIALGVGNGAYLLLKKKISTGRGKDDLNQQLSGNIMGTLLFKQTLDFGEGNLGT